MGRGGNQQQVQNQGNTMLANNSATAQQNQAEAQGAYGFLMPAYQSMYSNPGYTPAQKDAITRASEGGTGAAFGAAAQDATNTAARTNNAAGLTSNMDALARTRMQTAGAQTAQNETNFANNAQKQQSQALAGIGSLYTGATGAGLGYTGQANNTLGTLQKNAAAQKQGGFWNSFLNGLGSSLGNLNFSAGGGGGASGGFGG